MANNGNKRKLYSTNVSAQDCIACYQTGKVSCWDKVSNQSFCCGPSDIKCIGLGYCSDKIQDEALKLITCPVDNTKCPSNSVIQIK